MSDTKKGSFAGTWEQRKAYKRAHDVLDGCRDDVHELIDAAVLEAERLAYERAAKVCDESEFIVKPVRGPQGGGGRSGGVGEYVAETLASRIRQLKGTDDDDPRTD